MNKNKIRFIIETITYVCAILVYIAESKKMKKYEEYDEYKEW